MQEKLKNLTKDLISFKSTAENVDEKKRIVEFAHNWFKGKNIFSKIYHHEHSPAIHVQIPGKKQGKVLMMGHLDVVPGPEKMFSAFEKKGKIFGRGAIDNKGAVAVLMLLSEIIEKKKIPSVEILLTSDEETGGMEGAKKFSQLDEFKNFDAMFIPDGGEENVVVCKEKGIIHIEIETRGKASHGSTPWEGENAIEKAWEIFQDIKNHFSSEDCNCPDHWHATVNLGKISGGEAINQVPDRAQIGVDVRFTDRYNLANLEKDIKRIVSKKARIKRITSGDVLDSDPNHPRVQNYLKIAQEVFGRKIKIRPEHGASDARHFNHLGVPIWLHYPNGGGHHGKNEWVEVASLEKMMIALRRYLEEF